MGGVSLTAATGRAGGMAVLGKTGLQTRPPSSGRASPLAESAIPHDQRPDLNAAPVPSLCPRLKTGSGGPHNQPPRLRHVVLSLASTGPSAWSLALVGTLCATGLAAGDHLVISGRSTLPGLGRNTRSLPTFSLSSQATKDHTAATEPASPTRFPAPRSPLQSRAALDSAPSRWRISRFRLRSPSGRATTLWLPMLVMHRWSWRCSTTRSRRGVGIRC